MCLTLLLCLTLSNHRAQEQFSDPDFARVAEGNAATPGTAQFLIARENMVRRSIQIGRILFHHNFALDKNGGCNGVPCPQRSKDATTTGPDSHFEAGSCADCHSTPAGSAGFGPQDRATFTAGNTIRTPDMFGAGLIQALAQEATEDLQKAARSGRPLVTENGISYETGLGVRNGGGVDPDFIVKPFGRKGVESHIRAFISRAAFSHLGLQTQDRFQCANGDDHRDGRCAGLIKPWTDPDGDGTADELSQGAVSLMEHFLVNYPMPGRGPVTPEVRDGELAFRSIGCSECHRPEMSLRQDPRVEHLTISWNGEKGRAEATRRWLYQSENDGYLDPDRQRPVARVAPLRRSFVVPLYSDLKRHEMGSEMADRADEEGVAKSVFITRPLWGVGSYNAFLHDGSAKSIEEAITRHGGEAIEARKRFTALSAQRRASIKAFLKSLVLFSVEDVLTARIPITSGDLP